MCRLSLVVFLCLLPLPDRLQAFVESGHHADLLMASRSGDAEIQTQMVSKLRQQSRFHADDALESELGNINRSEESLKHEGQVGQIHASRAREQFAQASAEAAPATAAGEFRPAIDGEFRDWADVGDGAVHVDDGVGDAEGEFDVDRLSAILVANRLFVRFSISKALNLQSGKESDGNLWLELGLPRDRSLTIDFRGRNALLRTPGSANRIPWSQIAFESLPTYAATEFELLIDLSPFGLEAGDTVSLSMEGSDRLNEPALLVANGSDLKKSDLPLTKRPDGTHRIASMNTLHSGLHDPDRLPTIGSMLEYVDADVICFNEEWDEEEFRAGAARVLGENVNLLWKDGCGIASELELKPLDLSLERGVAALVDFDDCAVVVISVHFKCCGYSGSKEDLERIEEATRVAKEIARIREGDYGSEAKDAGVIVIGDYNLVGSREPLSILEQAGLNAVMFRSPVTGHASTWRGLRDSESFWPGRLDYATVDESRLHVKNAFAVTGSEMAALAPESNVESSVSDHALLVVDVLGE